MQHVSRLVYACLLSAISYVASAATPLEITLSADQGNPPLPQMGDRMQFRSVIRNGGPTSALGLVAWISVIEVDAGHEEPVDLEDWSAHKAITRPVLAPGQQFTVEWPLRLIQAGVYRVAVSTMERGSSQIITSSFIDIRVKRKPVVETQRILPVALGVPLLFGSLALWRVRRDNNHVKIMARG